MQILQQDEEGVTLAFDRTEMGKIAEPILQNAEEFRRYVLDLAYVLADHKETMEHPFQDSPRH